MIIRISKASLTSPFEWPSLPRDITILLLSLEILLIKNKKKV